MNSAIVFLLLLCWSCVHHHHQQYWTCNGFYYNEEAEVARDQRRELQMKEWIRLGVMEEPSKEEQQLLASKKRQKNANMKMLQALHRSSHANREQGLFDLEEKKKRDPRRHTVGRSVTMTAILTQVFIDKHKDDDKLSLTWDQMADKCDEWMVREI